MLLLTTIFFRWTTNRTCPSLAAVTICNINRIMENRIPNDTNLNNLLDILGQIPDYYGYYEFIPWENYDYITFEDLNKQCGFNLDASVYRPLYPHRNGSILRSIVKGQLLKSHILNRSQFRIPCYQFDFKS